MPCFDEWTLNWHGESNIDSVLENAPPPKVAVRCGGRQVSCFQIG